MINVFGWPMENVPPLSEDVMMENKPFVFSPPLEQSWGGWVSELSLYDGSVLT